jgi:hypothetical protein
MEGEGVACTVSNLLSLQDAVQPETTSISGEVPSRGGGKSTLIVRRGRGMGRGMAIGLDPDYSEKLSLAQSPG